jgi:hypothetical protein
MPSKATAMDASTAIRVEDLTTIAIAHRIRRKTRDEQMLASAFAQTPEKQRFGSSIWPLVLGIRPNA